jgi:hypothetical protein
LYYDLFRNGNINRSKENSEAILVALYEYNNAGSSTHDYRSAVFIPRYRNTSVAPMARMLVTGKIFGQYRTVR